MLNDVTEIYQKSADFHWNHTRQGFGKHFTRAYRKVTMGVLPIELEGLQQWVGCIIGIILGLIVQGDAQEYFVHMFETFSKRTKIRYELNPLHHLDLWSIPALFFAGWGWSKRRVAEPSYFPPSTAARCCVPLSGPLANFALVGILSTLYFFLPLSLLEVAIAINIQMALANSLIPIPPLALGRALCCPFDALRRRESSVEFLGKIVILILVLTAYATHWSIFQRWIMEPSAVILKWVLYR